MNSNKTLFTDRLLGDRHRLTMEHRLYNGVAFCAGLGCLAATIFNLVSGIPPFISFITFAVGTTYILLYLHSRRSAEYRPLFVPYVFCGIVLLTFTWFYNAGLEGAHTYVSMVALVAMIAVLGNRRWIWILLVFLLVITVFYGVEYFYPELVVRYTSRGQRFFDMYFTFTIATVVITSILAVILKSHAQERQRSEQANQLLEKRVAELNQTQEEMEEALANVRRLSGMLPICASCKKIRDDKGYWQQVELYIRERSDAEFSHGLCPDCIDKYMLEDDPNFPQ